MRPFQILGVVWAVALVAAARPAHAQVFAQAVPVKYNLTVRPGEPVARDVMISNLGDTPVVVRVHYSDWELSEEGELSMAPAGSTSHSLSGVVTFEPAQFSLQPGESGRIHLTMTLPIDGPATRWGLVLSEVRPAVMRSPKFGPRAIAELGTTIYLSRIPAEEIRPELTSMDVSRVGRDSLAVSIRMRNAGQRHLYVAGEIALSDSTGTKVKTGALGTGVVLPQQVRVFTWMCEAGLNPGRYAVTATLDTGEPELTVGETQMRWPMPAPSGVPLAQQRSP